MVIAVVGNGFDLRQGFKTGFDDFLNYFGEKYSNKNLLYLFFYYMKTANGWLDFEMHLQQFLICYSEFCILPSFRVNDEKYKIVTTEYIKSHNHYIFCDILSISVPIFSGSSYYDQITSMTSEWKVILEDKINYDIKEIKLTLKEYLVNIEQEHFQDFQPRVSPEVEILKLADSIINFNYTKFIEKIASPSKITYAHGTLSDDFVLGIPFTNDIKQRSLNIHFKTSQSVFNNYLSPIIQNFEITHIIFIGFSFGKSDHYYFQQVLDKVEAFEKYGIPICFHSFYFDTSSKFQLISNLREFFGENEFVRWFSNNQIKFHSYDVEFDLSCIS